jgi:aminopeptidase N
LGNAGTWDFEKVVEESVGKDLKPFFQQWLFTPGIPTARYAVAWKSGRLTF